MKRNVFLLLLSPLFLFTDCSVKEQNNEEIQKTHGDLVKFFSEWRIFAAPEIKNKIPDYSQQAMKKQHESLKHWQQRLNAFDTTGWTISEQVDWYLLYAEMNGMDFEHRVVRPWERDPAFYISFFSEASDVPEREGPTFSGAVELSAFKQPLSPDDATSITEKLKLIPEIYSQAQENLTGKSRDLWDLGTRSIREHAQELSSFGKKEEEKFPQLNAAAQVAAQASLDFAQWLEKNRAGRNELSGIGKEDYSWNLRYVHLLPFDWEDERVLLERELFRAHSGLRFAEHRNRKLPRLEKSRDAETHKKMLTEGTSEYMNFLQQEEFLTIKDYMIPAMMAQIRPFVASDGLRGFFDEIDHRDPMPMRAHFYHWMEKAREIKEPVNSQIRQTPLLYNIFDSRAEGFATAMEELVMNAGLLKDRPRATELIYIMLAQRAARGLGSIYQHGQEMDFDQATKYASKWVPWGLLPADGGTIQHEEHFYIQQPGYGSSYVTGKILIDQLIAEYARQREGNFKLREFMDDFTTRGIIPVSLLYWEMTGDKSVLNRALQK
jgi:hypothetical protein